MGFRGEALPSIASVSKFTLVTRTRQSNIATKIEIAGGKIRNVSDAGAPAGTMVEVRHLFYNTPARRKFLKSENTELGHIADIISAIALGNPAVTLRFFVNTRLAKHFPPEHSLYRRAVAVLGKDVMGNLYEFEAAEHDVCVTGVCSNPSVTRSSAGRLYFFVNNRVVYDPGLVAAVFRGYDGRVMKGRFPVGAVMIKMPFDRVDVNVHPCKREIKLFDPGPVYQLVTGAVAAAILKARKILIHIQEPVCLSFIFAKHAPHAWIFRAWIFRAARGSCARRHHPGKMVLNPGFPLIFWARLWVHILLLKKMKALFLLISMPPMKELSMKD
jgi:DNA mismatch repair protein MutL